MITQLLTNGKVNKAKESSDDRIQKLNVTSMISNSTSAILLEYVNTQMFIQDADEEGYITSVANYVVKTSDVHENESANILFVELNDADKGILLRPIMRFMLPQTAKVYSEAMMNLGTEKEVDAHDILTRSAKPDLAKELLKFIEGVEKTQNIHFLTDMNALFLGFDELIGYCLLEDNYDIFDMDPEEFVQQVMDSIIDEGDDVIMDILEQELRDNDEDNLENKILH